MKPSGNSKLDHFVKVCEVVSEAKRRGWWDILLDAARTELRHERHEIASKAHSDAFSDDPWFTGVAPYGYATDRSSGRARLVKVPAEQAVIRRMVDLRKRLNLSCGAIARELESDGVPSKRAKPWHSTTVSQILRREAMRGVPVPPVDRHRGGWGAVALTEAQRKEVLRLRGVFPARDIAARFGVCPTLIKNIWRSRGLAGRAAHNMGPCKRYGRTDACPQCQRILAARRREQEGTT